MKRGVNGFYSDHNSPSYKRLRRCIGERDSGVTGNSDPFAVPGLLEHIRSGKYGSVTKDVEALIARKMQMLQSLVPSSPSYPDLEDEPVQEKELESVVPTSNHIILIDSDEENDVEKIPSDVNDAEKRPHGDSQETEFPMSTNELVTDPVLVENEKASDAVKEEAKTFQEDIEKAKTVRKTEKKVQTEDEIKEEAETIHEIKDKGLYLGVEEELSEEDEDSSAEDDGLSDIWKEMSFAIETSRDVQVHKPPVESEDDDEGCDHSFVLKDDIGYLCRVCGVIKKHIETIFDFQYKKAAWNRSYRYESRLSKEMENSETHLNGLKGHEHDLAVTEVCPHPKHRKQMKPHQIEGFNFLLSNLVSENPGGCILAHAPGSGKTFMIISFMQSFLARYPDARPLVVLPKGILSTWKKEFQRWQIEDVSLLDFYSAKADSRAQQSEVLKQWVDQKSILFLGYQQFSTIVSDVRPGTISAYCRDVLLKRPSILILDEGHNPRNDNTDMLNTLASVVTPRKVVLSGTLYQNHVKEVFTILNLVRPKFLKLETSRTIQTRILSRVSFDGPKKSNFYDLVEHTLQQDSDFKRKEAVIKDLREMTSRVLHYYRGDFLDDLPGLLDFTILLQLMPQQKRQIQALVKREKQSFKKSSMGCAIYTHPMLKQYLVRKAGDEKNLLPPDEKIDKLVESIDWRDGVKAKFFYNVLGFCESTNEKLLVFSQYLLPLKFLERLAVCKKGYTVGKEIFTITGDTSAEQRETSMEQFNTSTDSRVLFGSIKACGEGISLVGASRVIILDVHLNPSVSRQAIGRAFRPGQEKKVYVYRLVAADSPEEKDHLTCFKKEQIAKRWFEWNEYSRNQDYDLEKVDPNDSGDMFLESDLLSHDILSLFTR